MTPLARTPMDRKSGRSMTKYSKSIKRFIDKVAPWKQLDAYRAKRRATKFSGLVPGEMAVRLNPGERDDHPLIKGSKIIK